MLRCHPTQFASNRCPCQAPSRERATSHCSIKCLSPRLWCCSRTVGPDFPLLCMAPEGTCGDGRCILQFRTGAFVPGMPVLPLMLCYEKQYHNPAWTIIYELWHFVRLVPCLCAITLWHVEQPC